MATTVSLALAKGHKVFGQKPAILFCFFPEAGSLLYDAFKTEGESTSLAQSYFMFLI